ncbi:orf57 [Alcelaphine gammaherpesvirus 2]|uniref:Orf57 n=1 Tax=Alcelaphine gammaherpesvirus 2 TaxID=138184 RepID=A0A068A9X4_9GAMA|nr:orf57 [Alcelaphine gammaherpesvirus 2]AIA62094.1 orf57 [Alcelaphine gammaherpesvirus 2]
MAQQAIITMNALKRTVEVADPGDISIDISAEDSNDSFQVDEDFDDNMNNEDRSNCSSPAPTRPSKRRVFMIPKRDRTKAPVHHTSPLSRLYPNVVLGKQQGYKQRQAVVHRRRHEPYTARKGAASQPAPTMSTSLVSELLKGVDPVIASKITDMRIPRSMIRTPSGQPFAHWLMPNREDSSKFINVTPVNMEVEEQPNVVVRRCTEWALISSRLQDKSISTQYLAENFFSFRDFAQHSINKTAWISLRREAIANAGLVNLCAFADEMMQWLQLNMRNQGSWKACREDIILTGAPDVCFHALQKIRGFIKCFLRERHQRVLVNSLCHIMCFEGGIREAASLCQELFFDFKLGLLVLFFLTPYAFLYSHTIPQCEFGGYFSKCVAQYTPGAVTGLLNSAIEDHFKDCTSKECANQSTAILSPETSNKGLLFFPLPL